ncbi:amino acid permease-domain-containing protein [Apiosordaria backusii]|uniref:Amino acid permease-domain-containing protein n=1 Tax=Apiosordaria backusii TaxID=314023 RepID=A0AA40E8F1_9PEZI|nr:amino acid permease-domain-containing protein [Apiosordaria backusii]
MGFPSLSALRGKRGEDVSVRKGSDDGVAGVENNAGISGSDSDDFAAIDPNSGVKRGLKTRHLSMMALAGIIGPGLLIGSGRALANGGPAALLIGFGVIGIIAFSIMQSLGELTTLYPTGGAFTGLSDRFVDKAFGVAKAWAAQGHSDSELPFKSMLYPYNAWFGLSTNIFLALIQGWATFAPFDAVDFVDAYILLPLFGVIYVVYKFWNKTKTVNIHTVDLDEGRRKDLDDGRRPLADGEEIDSTLPWYKRAWKSL